MAKKKVDYAKVLNLKFECTDLSETMTVKAYLKLLLKTLFEEGEGFSGKRPFGNSGWEHDLEKCFVENGIIEGKLDEDGYLESLDSEAYAKAIQKCIAALK